MTQDQSFWSGTEMGLIRLDKSVFSHSMTPGETISVSSASIKGAMAFEVSEQEAMEIASSEASCSLTFYEELVNRNRDQSVSDYKFFKPFITGLSNSTVDQVLNAGNKNATREDIYRMVSNKARISGTLWSHLVLKRPCKCLMVWWLLNLDTRCVPSANLSWNEVVSAAVSTKALLVVLVLRSFVWVKLVVLQLIGS
ncbi:hypothetical protein DY000_02039131 [Brassica cretica]|uniref:Uncharacterized protein n=1 Tax=Brassica cretica TaxID=69181 RepID=A0ABQ7BG58_BRACR|nr:hypothetical protein DY000_02039131 [Brassica cretica]